MTETVEKEVSEDPRPFIELRDELALVSDEALAALVGDAGSGLYVRAGMLVRVVRDNARKVRGLSRDAGAPVIEPVPLAWLRDRIDRAARWWAWRKKGKEVVRKPTMPPVWVAENVAARDELPFPPLEGVVEAPTMRRGGTILDQPGYDVASALLYEPTTRFPPMPETILPGDVKAARDRLLGLFHDFPFVEASDLSAAVSCILTAAARPAIDGPCPLFAVRATTPGSGKTLLADVVAVIATGRTAARMAAGKDDDETRKLLLAIGLEGASVVLLDNVEGSLGSAAFAAALTSTTFADRILGASKRITVSLRTVTWIATGNNLAFRGDLGRRVVPIDIDVGLEHPEDRVGFKHENLVQHVRDDRPALVIDALTILRGYVEAASPPHGKSRFGSFEAWDDLVRGACVWSGLPDPIAGRERVREEGDDELERLRAALSAWSKNFGANETTVREAVDAADHDSELKDALTLFAGGREFSALRLGHALRKFKGRLCDGARFKQAGTTGGRPRWFVENRKSPTLPFAPQNDPPLA